MLTRWRKWRRPTWCVCWKTPSGRCRSQRTAGASAAGRRHSAHRTGRVWPAHDGGLRVLAAAAWWHALLRPLGRSRALTAWYHGPCPAGTRHRHAAAVGRLHVAGAARQGREFLASEWVERGLHARSISGADAEAGLSTSAAHARRLACELGSLMGRLACLANRAHRSNAGRSAGRRPWGSVGSLGTQHAGRAFCPQTISRRPAPPIGAAVGGHRQPRLRHALCKAAAFCKNIAANSAKAGSRSGLWWKQFERNAEG